MLLHDATLPDGSKAEVRLDGALISEVRPAGGLAGEEADSLDLSGYVLLPAPAEPHAHLDKALTAERVDAQPGDLNAAIEAWHAHRADLREEEIARRAESTALIALARGTTAVRTHVDVGDEFERPVDLHMDEHLRPSVDLEDMVRLMADGFPQPVTASHCTSLGMQSAEVQDRLAGEVAAAGIAVVTCPGTNLHLLGRGVRTATPRGLTALQALLRAGVLVAGGGDNVQDFFHPLGCGDPLQTAALLVLAGQLDVHTAYRLVSENARAMMGLPGAGVAPGAPADLVAVAAGSLQEALSTTTEDRVVFRAGRVVSRTSVVRQQLERGGSD